MASFGLSTPVPYVELHAHSAYSFLDGASLPAELAEQARTLGHAAFALTDHDSVAGSMEFAHAARAAGIAAIHGAEVTVRRSVLPPVHQEDAGALATPGIGAGLRRGVGVPAREEHLTLLVESRAGWQSLCRLLTHAHAHTRDHPQRQRTEPSVTLEQVAEHAEGLICLSGCASHGVEDRARLGMLLEAFGRDGLRIELQRPYARDDRTRIRHRRRLAAQLGVEAVVTGNVHA
ncbi:MAG: PHP domain-containing protein, partial [Herbiconiux sp.]|nr:PHP domain-containing protein [Herbiconiux sp.]